MSCHCGVADILRRAHNPLESLWPNGPPTFGNPGQIRVLRILNGPDPYCDHCLDVLEGGGFDDLGTACLRSGCPGVYVPGAAMEKRHAVRLAEAAD